MEIFKQPQEGDGDMKASAMSAMGLRVAVATFFMVHPEK